MKGEIYKTVVRPAIIYGSDFQEINKKEKLKSCRNKNAKINVWYNKLSKIRS